MSYPLPVDLSFSVFHQYRSATAGGRLKAEHGSELLFTFVYAVRCLLLVESDASKPFSSNPTDLQERTSPDRETEGFTGDVTLQVRFEPPEAEISDGAFEIWGFSFALLGG